MTFAGKLRELRQHKGLSQEGLARASGLSLGVIRDYEQTEKLPSLLSAFKLAEALGVSLDVFKECVLGRAAAGQAEPPAAAEEPAGDVGQGKPAGKGKKAEEPKAKKPTRKRKEK